MEDAPVARTKRILIGILVGAGLLLVPVAGAPLAIAGNPCYHGYEVPQLTVAAGNEVETEPCAFAPTISVVDAGDTVTFRNGGAEPHLVTGANADWGDRDIQLDAGESVAYTFAEPGVYPYACTLHPGMSGAIVVGDGGPSLAAAFAAAGSARDGSGSGGAPSAAVNPVSAPAAHAPDPLVVAAVAALVGAALALAVVLVAARTRARKPAADPANPTPEPLTR
jgi:plastocyanin